MFSKLMGPRTSTWLRRNRHPLRMDEMKYFFLRDFFFFSFSKWTRNTQGTHHLFLFIFISIYFYFTKCFKVDLVINEPDEQPWTQEEPPSRSTRIFFWIFQTFLS